MTLCGSSFFHVCGNFLMGAFEKRMLGRQHITSGVDLQCVPYLFSCPRRAFGETLAPVDNCQFPSCVFWL
ncbi:MAG TPA: hypothetical protein DEF45_23240 [Rhodopirellula sp.]|nr:hypothetical protein [Rhodopirellula sp.]